MADLPPAETPAPEVTVAAVATPALASTFAQQEAIKRVIERADNQQADAFAKRDPRLMRDTAVDAYYDQLAVINQNMASEGVAAIKLLGIDWGTITVDGDSAQATAFETWRTDYLNGTGEEARDRNDYTLARSGGSWKIVSDAHPESQLDQPVASPSPGPSAGPSSATPSPSASPAGGRQSHNWAGYSATGGGFTAVSASWRVPRPAATVPGADAAWVGIGGIRGHDLIQAGTEQNVSRAGRITYQAWIELLPKLSHPVQLTVSPGDAMTVSISEQRAGVWLIRIKDDSTGQAFQSFEEYDSSHSSAEWIEEAPSGRRGVLPLSDFGEVAFRAAGATKGGKPVGVAGAAGRALTMVDGGKKPLAEPSALGADGASFTVRRAPVAPASPGGSLDSSPPAGEGTSPAGAGRR